MDRRQDALSAAFADAGISFQRVSVGLDELEARLGAEALRKAHAIIAPFEHAGLPDLRPNPDVIDMLHIAAGKKLAVVSSNRRSTLIAALERLDLLDLFQSILGGDDISPHKPAPDGLLLTLQRLDVIPARAVFLGDRDVDMTAALRAGVRPVLVAIPHPTSEAPSL